MALFILCETTPEILGLWVELEFPAMGTILLIIFKLSTSSTTNHFSVFPTELKDRLAILHVHRFRLSGSSCNVLCFISMQTPSLLLAFTPVFIHTISLFHFVIHLGINIIKSCYKLCTLYGISAFVYFQIIGDE